MTRTLAITVAGLLAFSGPARAQLDNGNGPQTRYQRLVNSRYVPDDEGAARRSATIMNQRIPSVSFAPGTTDPAFTPLMFLDRVYQAQLGREPTEQERLYWLRRLSYQTREEVTREIALRKPTRWMGYYDPALGRDYDPGPGSSFFPDPTSKSFRDPGGPYFDSPYWPNYEYRGPIRRFPIGNRG